MIEVSTVEERHSPPCILVQVQFEELIFELFQCIAFDSLQEPHSHSRCIFGNWPNVAREYGYQILTWEAIAFQQV